MDLATLPQDVDIIWGKGVTFDKVHEQLWLKTQGTFLGFPTVFCPVRGFLDFHGVSPGGVLTRTLVSSQQTPWSC